ncbi:MAG: diaminopimelate decarboxylase [Hyphomicrobiales bacterium]|nr:diaminopimelate decarboxylase [Hyphomicrobiales bacterium]MDE2115483.1 diaminopimelate decarboxylase [Hyphomicrobiales bacterium]
MNEFTVEGGALHAEKVALADIAREVGTPFYCYSRAAFEERYQTFSSIFEGTPHLLCYAMKANSNQAILTTLARLGAGMDVVSEGELRRALAAGVPGEKIVFSGVGKTEPEMAFALDAGILCFNVESEPELEHLSQVAVAKGTRARISVRVNPDVDAGTHAKISTGTYANKFGIPIDEAPRVYERAAKLPGIEITGVDMHIGSQITDLKPFDRATARLAALARQLMGQGHKLTHIDVGGGLGVVYQRDNRPPPSPHDYAQTILKHTGGLGLKLVFEHGRLLAANSGVLVTSVIYVKQGAGKRFVIVDAAMNDLIRPTLYDAYHEITTVQSPATGAKLGKVDIVGPVCESGDYLAQNRDLPPVESGDLLAVHSAGAYGAVQAGEYNTRPLIPEVLVDGERWAVVRARPSYEAMIRADIVPPWLALK